MCESASIAGRPLDTNQHPFLIHAGGISTTCVLLFFTKFNCRDLQSGPLASGHKAGTDTKEWIRAAKKETHQLVLVCLRSWYSSLFVTSFLLLVTLLVLPSDRTFLVYYNRSVEVATLYQSGFHFLNQDGEWFLPPA